MPAKRRSLYELPGATDRGGYVYALLYSTGVVQVGRTVDARAEATERRKVAQSIGCDLADWWTSIAHYEWIANERELARACGALGGKRTGPGYFSGIGFPAVAEAAAALPFTSAMYWAHGRRHRTRETPEMRDKRMAVAVRMRAQGKTVREIAEWQRVSHTTIENDLARWERVKGEMPMDILRLARVPGNKGWQTEPDRPSSEDACLPGEVAKESGVIPFRRPA